MSEVIVGDLNVGRDIYSGGNANIAGNATIKRNLKVEGWLDAKNIKHIAKGLFQSQEALEEAYPEPQNGWVAFVGKGFPADTYIAEGGEWKESGVATDLKVELTNYVHKDTLNEYATTDVVNELSRQVGGFDGRIEEASSDATTALERANATKAQVDGLEFIVQNNSDSLSVAENKIEAIKQTNIEQENKFTNIQKTLDANNTYIATLENRVQNAEDVIDTKTTSIETANATQNLWHEAHSIVNLHRFPYVPTVIEKNAIGEYIRFVPSRLVRNGLIILGYNGEEWEAWQLINTEDIIDQGSYKRLNWDNSSLVLGISVLNNQVDAIKADIHDIEEVNTSQDTTLDEHFVLITQLQAKDTELSNQVLQLQRQFDSIDLRLRDIELRLDNM